MLSDHYCQSDRQFSDVQETQPRVFDTLTNKDMTQTLMTSKEMERINEALFYGGDDEDVAEILMDYGFEMDYIYEFL